MLRSFIDGLTVATKFVATAANVAGTLVVLGLVVVVNFDIVARGVFNQPFRGAYEVVQFTMVLIVFLQLPDVCRVNKLTRSDGLLALIGTSHPRLSATLRRAINLISTIIMALIAIAIFPEFLDMWDTQDFFGVPGIFTAPWWPIKLTILCSATLCALIFGLKVISKSGSDTPQ
ncbi:MAG: TRAP transporter small permease subunit [Aliishimia sp.]